MSQRPAVLTPSNLLTEHVALPCDACGRDVLSSLTPGDSNRTNAIMFVIRTMREEAPARVLSIYVCCKGRCDDVMKSRRGKLPPRVIDLWSEIDDLLIPIRNLQRWIELTKDLAAGVIYQDKARGKLLDVLCATAPFVTRSTTEGEHAILEKEAVFGF